MRILLPSVLTQIHLPILKEKEIELYLKRDDLIHEVVSGNKWRKLKYNIESAQKNNVKTTLTFGGAYSNHIIATAFACKENGLKSIGIIRGDEIKLQLQKQEAVNHTLKYAQELGMQLHFISREEYKRKEEKDFIQELKNKFGEFYLIEEGGANPFGIEGCKEILKEENTVYNFICCAAGTGTTLTGLLLSLRENEKLLGFSALKGGDFLKEVIEKNISEYYKGRFDKAQQPIHKMSSLELICDYHFGGYAKVNDELKNFVADFNKQTDIQLDLIYNGKMMFGLLDLIQKDHFPKKSRILAIHTGGVQGNRGFL